MPDTNEDHIIIAATWFTANRYWVIPLACAIAGGAITAYFSN
jgi:hypothetical protein